jgi:hypothetical protein
MDQATLEKMVRTGKVSSERVLAHTPLDRLDDTLTLLKQHREIEEICRALMERMAIAPFPEFGALKALYFKHFLMPMQ